jgi:hypothetical protein
MPSDGVQDATAQEVTPVCARRGSGHLVDLHRCRTLSRINRVLKVWVYVRRQTGVGRGVYEPAFKPPPLREGSGRTSQGQNHIREIRPCGIAGRLA